MYLAVSSFLFKMKQFASFLHLLLFSFIRHLLVLIMKFGRKGPDDLL